MAPATSWRDAVFGEHTVIRGRFGIYYYPQKRTRMLQGAANAAVHKKFTLPGNVDITFPATSGNVRSTITPSRQFQFAVRLDFR